ncbi:MAG TPA: hypothetical protein VES97_04745 [Solirubrobacteraceae bacterium]|nr:hypothetical protein [Solirubrobacteraceae bacterium]
MTLLPEVRSQLHAAAERRSRSPRTRLLSRLSGPRLSGRWRRAPLISLGVGLALVGAAFGAGLIQLGAPAKLPFSLLRNSHEGYGALVPGTVRMLPIAAPDPAGGPDWGMRVLSTTRGEGCIQIGRLLDGKLGALGQDHAFADDGRFHELPVSAAFDINGCALLDGKGRLFTNVTADERPASAWIGTGGRLGGCVPASAGPYEKGLRLTGREREMGLKPVPICPQADLRNIYYGLLGPEAQSITYVLAGQRHTLPTVGSDGAYLFVTRASAHQLLNFANAGTADIVPVDGPIKEIHYRDGSTCHLTSKSWIGGSYACTPSLSEPVGYLPVGKAPTHAEVATPIHARLTRGSHGRYVITISFTARLAVTDARRIYGMRWREPGMAPGAYGGEATNSNIAAGQTITKTIGEYGPRIRAGTVHGTVTLRQALGAGGIEGPGSVSVPVGSFAVRVP